MRILRSPLTVTATLRRQSGFSLLETIVAMVILSLALGVLYQAVSGATRNTRVAAEHAEALMLAQSVLDQNRYVYTPEFTEQGEFGSMRWRVLVRPVDQSRGSGDEMGGGLEQVLVQVEWGDSLRPRSVELMTIVPLLQEPTP